MSKIIAISAYPKGRSSLGESLLTEAKGNRDIELLNLYDTDISFYHEEGELNREAKIVFDKLNQNNNWLFLYPVWWSNMPAILKNFFDWGIRYGLIYDGKSVPKAALKGQNKKAAVLCTSGDIYGDDQKSILNQVASEILPYWGVDVIGTMFVEDTYNFNNQRFENSQKELADLFGKF